MIRLVSMVLVLIGLLAGTAMAGEDGAPSYAPKVPKAAGAPHPEGNEYWRVNHRNLLTHDRDLTMRLGDREIQASLKECVACHAVQDPVADPVEYVGYESDQYFCRVCHDYVAVKVDCFTCHQSKPDEEIRARLLSLSNALLPPPADDDGQQALADYIDGVTRATSGKVAANTARKPEVGQ